MDRPDPSEPHQLLAAYRDLERMPPKKKGETWLRLQAAIRAESTYAARPDLAPPADTNSQDGFDPKDVQRERDDSRHELTSTDSHHDTDPTDSQGDRCGDDSRHDTDSTDSQHDADPADSPPIVLRSRSSRRAVWGAALLAAAALALLFAGLRDLMTRELPATPDLAPHTAPADTDANTQAPLLFATHTTPAPTPPIATPDTPPRSDLAHDSPIAAPDTPPATDLAHDSPVAAPDDPTRTSPDAPPGAPRPVAFQNNSPAPDAPPHRPRSDKTPLRRDPPADGPDLRRPISDPLLDPDDPAPPPAADSPEQPPSAGLDVELSLLRRARAALTAASPGQALELLAEHARRFPSGHLAEERMLLRVQALCAVGEPERARATARAFARAHPGSPHTPTITAVCRE